MSPWKPGGNRLRLGAALVVLGVAAGEHDHHVLGRIPVLHAGGDAGGAPRAAGAHELVELEVVRRVDDAAALVVGDGAVVVEAEVAVDVDRALDLEHVGDVVPGKLADEVPERVVHLARVAGVVGRDLGGARHAVVEDGVGVEPAGEATCGAVVVRPGLGVVVPVGEVDRRLRQVLRRRPDRVGPDLVHGGAR